MVNAVETMYEAQGYTASRETIKVQEKLFMRINWPEVENLLNKHIPKYAQTAKSRKAQKELWQGLNRAVYGYPQPDYEAAKKHFKKLMAVLKEGPEVDMEVAEIYWQRAMEALYPDDD